MTTAEQDAIKHEMTRVLNKAGGERPAGLGCSLISHERIGFCSGCVHPRGYGANLELLAWRLLGLQAKAERRDGA